MRSQVYMLFAQYLVGTIIGKSFLHLHSLLIGHAKQYFANAVEAFQV